MRTAVAPPSTTSLTVLFMSISPGIGPALMPWSMGTMTAFPLFLSMILSILMLLPNIPIAVRRVSTAHYKTISIPETNPRNGCERSDNADRSGPDGPADHGRVVLSGQAACASALIVSSADWMHLLSTV